MHISALSMPISLKRRMMSLKSSKVCSTRTGGMAFSQSSRVVFVRSQRPNLHRTKKASAAYARASLPLTRSRSGFTSPRPSCHLR